MPTMEKDILSSGDPGDMIGYVSCAITSMTILLSGHGYAETPKTLNRKLENVNSFGRAGMLRKRQPVSVIDKG